MVARQSAARATYASILKFLEQAEVYVAHDRKPNKVVAPLCEHLIRGASIRSAKNDGKDRYGPRIKVQIKGVPFVAIFDPHYFAAMRLAELGGTRFIPDKSVKDNVSPPAVQRERNTDLMPWTIVMAPPEESSDSDRNRHSLLRMIAATETGFQTIRTQRAEDHRRATLVTEPDERRKDHVPVIARSTRNREDIIEFVVDVARSKMAFSDKLPNLEITLETFERQFRRALFVADAIHQKLFPRTPPAEA